MQRAANLIKSSNDILIMTHKNPDGDAVGSVLGLAEALEGLGKNTTCFSRDLVPEVFKFLPNVSIIKNDIEPSKFDLAVLLDCASFSRTGIDNTKKAAISFKELLIIDHHPRCEYEIENNHFDNCVCVTDCHASSTAVLIYNILKELDIDINKDVANCLLTGIFTDTGGFQHNNTDQRSLEAAAEFMKKGSRVDKIAKNIFNSKTVPAIKLWGKALSRVRTYDEIGMAISYLSKKDIEECGAKEEDVSGLVGVINTISDARFSLLLTEYKNKKIRGSLRSEEYKGVDVSSIAKSLGGGGHKLASGFEINGSIKESIVVINEAILRVQRKTEQF